MASAFCDPWCAVNHKQSLHFARHGLRICADDKPLEDLFVASGAF